MDNHILFVFEGKRTEDLLYRSLSNYFITEDSIITCAYCAEVYQLYEQVKEDEYLNVFSLLKEIPENEKILMDYSTSDFSQIYLFFDYDGHSSIADDKSVEKLLKLFNEETSFGKMYLSYPMVEALRHCSENFDFETLTVEAKKNIRYKKIVDEQSDKTYKQVNNYDLSIWRTLINLHLKKMNKLIKDSFSLPTKTYSQEDIFFHQLDKYIKPKNEVAVLGAFPIFLLDYYGVNTLKQKVTRCKENK